MEIASASMPRMERVKTRRPIALREVRRVLPYSLRTLIALACFGLATAAAQEAAYPSRPIRIVVPAAPGGVTDILAPQLFEPITSSPEQFAEFIRTEAQEWGKVARDAKLKVD